MNQNEITEKYISRNSVVSKEGNVFVWEVPAKKIVAVCKDLYFEHKLPLKTITAADNRKEGNGFRIFYVFGVPGENVFLAPFITLKDQEGFPSVTKDIHEASGYERRIKTFFGLTPVGHPNPRGMLLHENWPEGVFPLRKDFDWRTRPAIAEGKYKFLKVEGEGIYEIPVGPVHAGIIEPGHFRFSVAGEEILLLEPKLGYKHKGTEKLFETLPLKDKVRLSERVSGDTSFTHSLAFCQAAENLAGINIPERAKYLRVVFSELERLANHFNDIGFIMLDAGYGFGGSNGARLRETVMQLHEGLSGSRYLRGVNAIGGVKKDISTEKGKEVWEALEKMRKDFTEVIEIAGESNTLFNRLQSTGKLDYQLAVDHGVLGVAGRGVGIRHDARLEYPYAGYPELKFNIALEKDGDVRARFHVRVKEVHSSIAIIGQALEKMALLSDNKLPEDQEIIFRKNSFAVGVAEGWRGEIVYFILTDSAGNISRADVRDPSFINWTVLGHAGKGNVVPDFPLINKSFDLSYSGNDL